MRRRMLVLVSFLISALLAPSGAVYVMRPSTPSCRLSRLARIPRLTDAELTRHPLRFDTQGDRSDVPPMGHPRALKSRAPLQGKVLMESYQVLHDALISRVPVVGQISEGLLAIGEAVNERVAKPLDRLRRIERNSWKLETDVDETSASLSFTLRY
ncbi:MAG: hypothetical protein V1809_02955 [Planctomycetota bacterium]